MTSKQGFGFLEPFKDFFKFKEEINQVIDKIHPRNVSEDYLQFVSGPAKYKDLSKPIEEGLFLPNWDMLDRSKSYLRPLVFLLTIKGLNKNPANFVKYASILELIHNGTLIHDDIEDKAIIRRNDKPLYLKYGVDTAVNSANILYFSPFLIFKKYGDDLSNLTRLKAYDCLIEHLNRVTWGQGLDILWHKSQFVPSVEDYLQMCSYKTGAIDRMVFSFAAVLAEVDDIKKKLLEEFGEKFGIFLQIHDDLCDICAVDRYLIGGKVIGNDIIEGKKSFVNIIALDSLPPKERSILLEILDKDDPNKDVLTALNIIKKSGALEKSFIDITRLSQELISLISSLISESESLTMKDFLEGMCIDLKNKLADFYNDE